MSIMENSFWSFINDFAQTAQSRIFKRKDMVILVLEGVKANMFGITDHDDLGDKKADQIFVGFIIRAGFFNCMKHIF